MELANSAGGSHHGAWIEAVQAKRGALARAHDDQVLDVAQGAARRLDKDRLQA